LATRFYISTLGDVPPISPAKASQWEFDSRAASGFMLLTSPTAELWPFGGGNSPNAVPETNTDYLLGQLVSPPLLAGQTIDSQTVSAQFLAYGSAVSPSSVRYLMLGCRVVAADGTTIQRTLFSPVRDNVAIASTDFENRSFVRASTFTSYVTVSGDRLVFEVGAGGDWYNAIDGAAVAFGSETGTDLPVDDTTTTHGRPWIELEQDLLFDTEPVRPAKASLVLTGHAPTIRLAKFVRPAKASLILTGYAPRIVIGGGLAQTDPPGISAAGGFFMMDEEDLL
jgi:hypothetical protein